MLNLTRPITAYDWGDSGLFLRIVIMNKMEITK